MARPLLSAALIVRDEERFLEGCLRSLDGVADEIVVVDTGSVDRSAEIAREFGALVSAYAWNGDFAAARNASIDAARGDWILYIDADERVVTFDRSEVERQLADPARSSYTVLFRPQTGFTRYREYRLFRKRDDLRFRGVMHESLLPALHELEVRTGMATGHSAICLDHYGYDGDLRRKHERNLPLLRARLASDPMHVFSWAHLGATLLGLGDESGAERAWRQGIDVVRSLRSRAAADSLAHLHLANFLIDRHRDAGALLAEATTIFPDNYSLLWLQATTLVAAGSHVDAMSAFARLAAVDPATLDGGPLAFDISIFGAHAHAGMGLCAFRLGRFADSAECYARAEALAPADIGIRSRRQLAEARARDAMRAASPTA